MVPNVSAFVAFGQAKNAKAAGRVGWARTKAEGPDTFASIGALFVAAEARRRLLLVLGADGVAGLSVISRFTAANPAGINGAFRALTDALSGSSPVAFSTRAKVMGSNLLVAMDILV